MFRSLDSEVSGYELLSWADLGQGSGLTVRELELNTSASPFADTRNIYMRLSDSQLKMTPKAVTLRPLTSVDIPVR
jgi:hypothetical protein